MGSTSESLQQGSVILMVFLFYILFFLIGFLPKAMIAAGIRNYTFGATSLDGKVFLRSDVAVGALWSLYVTNLLIMIFTLGLGIAWVKVRTARFLAENTMVLSDDSLDDYVTQQHQQQNAIGDEIGEAFDVVAVGFEVGV